MFVLYNSIYIPIDIALFNVNKHPGQCIFDYAIVDVLFIVDMLLNLRTTYYDEEGELVLDSRVIWKRYVFSYWCMIDTLAVFPFDIVVNAASGQAVDLCDMGSQSNDANVSVVKLLKALRLLRLVRFRKELDRLSGANALRVIVSLSIFILVAHWLACIWWAIGYIEFQADEAIAQAANISVVCDNSHQCSWLRRIPGGEPLAPSSPFEAQYFSAMFWSLTTLMKTPWVGPDTVAEKIFATLAIFAGAIFYAYFLSTVQGSYAIYSKRASQKRDKISNLNAFLKAFRISTPLGQKLIQHTTAQAAWLPLGLVNSNVLMQLPSHLRGAVALEMYAVTCGDPSSMFPALSIEGAKALVMRLHTQLVMQDQVLISQKEVCCHLYFLMKGALRVTSEAPSTAGEAEFGRQSVSGAPDGAVVAGASRMSSRKGFGGAREIERPGASVGLVEPIDPASLGLYPAWVTASKKTLVLYITQREMADALDGFRADIDPLRDALVKQHASLMDSLKISPTADSPITMCELGVQRRKEQDQTRKGMHLTEDDTARVCAIEASVHDTMANVTAMKNDMASLPRILQLIQAATDKDMMPALTNR